MTILCRRLRRISSSHGCMKNAEVHRITSGQNRCAAARIGSRASRLAWSRSRYFRTSRQPHGRTSPVSASALLKNRRAASSGYSSTVSPRPVRASDQPLNTSGTDHDGPGAISSQRNYTPGMTMDDERIRDYVAGLPEASGTFTGTYSPDTDVSVLLGADLDDLMPVEIDTGDEPNPAA